MPDRRHEHTQTEAVMEEIFGDREWWKSASEETCRHAVSELLLRGFAAEEIHFYVGSVFYAACEEYGGG